MNRVGIILVNYNGYEDTVECLKSLQKINYKNFVVIVVDNASTKAPTDTQIEYIRNNSIYYQTNSNLGFSGGNNVGIKIAKENDCSFVLLLNNDTTVEPDFLDELMSAQSTHKNTGIVTGKIYYYAKDKIWSAGGKYNRNTGVTSQFGGKDSKEFNKSGFITFATGCLMLIPMKVIKEVGYLAESYFLYSEDTDYCQRVIDADFNIYYCASSIIYHKVSASVGNMSAMQERYMMRNNLYMIQKYGKLKPFTYLYFFLHTSKDILRGRNHLKPVLIGTSDFFHHKKGKITE